MKHFPIKYNIYDIISTRKAIILLWVCLLSINTLQVISQPKREVRAVWLTTIGGLDWPHTYAQSPTSIAKQQKEFIGILDKLRRANVNTILLQTRIRGTVIYPSQYEPWDGCLSGFPGRSPGYDALGFAIRECHKRGMELHAWVVTIPLGKWTKEGAANLRKKYPKLCIKQGDECYMNPEMTGTAKYITDICEEITRNYDIDGIHLDYIRYPETLPVKGDANHRRAHITNIVRNIHDAVKRLKPWVKMSCSPIGKYSDLARYSSHGWNARETVSQDAQMWIQSGLMDQLYPMMYFKDNQFFPFAIDWQECSQGRTIAPGLGIYFMSPSEKDWSVDIIQREMSVLRQNGLGHAYFRSKFFTDNLKGLYDFACNDFDAYPAIVPAMTWQCGISPSTPQNVSVDKVGNYDILKWCKSVDRSDSPYITYNIYASSTRPVDTDNPQNLIATMVRDTVAAFMNRTQKYYAVTAMNRYGNESATQTLRTSNISFDKLKTKTEYFDNDGSSLSLPPKPATLDADFIIIKSIAGTAVATMPYKGYRADITRLPEGIYSVYSLNEKGVSHRLGQFIIRR